MTTSRKALLTCGIFLLTACGISGDVGDPPNAGEAASSNGFEQASGLSLVEPSNEDMEAAIDGRLVNEGGCIGLEVEPDEFTELAWPEDDVEWRAGEEEIVFRETVLELGDTVSLGGGTRGAEALKYTSRPTSCQGVERTWVVGSLLS